MNTAIAIIDAIRNPAIPFTPDQVREAWNAIKARSDAVTQLQAASFRKGDTVTFQDRHGQTIEGTVTKVNSKTLSVRVGPVNWKVTATLCTKKER